MEAGFEFDAEVRSEEGTRAARGLRRANRIPAVLYGGNESPLKLALAKNQVVKNFSNEAIFSHILSLRIPRGGSVQAVLKEVQRHPATGAVMHLDFQRVKADEAIRVHVPIHFVGEDTCPGIKEGGILLRHLTEVEVVCLPRHLPEYIEADISGLNLGESILLGEIKVPEGVEITELVHEGGESIAVATVQPPMQEEAAEEVGEEVGEEIQAAGETGEE